MTPEETARAEIDAILVASGSVAQDRSSDNFSAARCAGEDLMTLRRRTVP
jgi:hypothetical protein